ncbi:hypothetical protein ACE2AJ_16570 [Aquihabitans daechungensis]|uniref:hypothetical protein n=1 Tax=Aquihabitans daechungensis TaxID=1052257 RepID=UPI003B9DFE85
MVERAPRTGIRIRALGSPERWLVIATLVVFGVLPFASALVASSSGWQATGDTAIIGLRARDAWTGDAPLLGVPTTGDRSFGTPSNNPGPIEYWTLGATARLFGPQAGLILGIAAINAAALVGVAWLAFRRGGTELLALTAVALAGLVWTLGPVSLWDPFNSEVTTYPMLLALFAAWSVVIGDLRVLPVLVASATVAAQVHVAGAAFVAPLVAVVVISLLVVARRRPKAIRRDAAYLGGAGALGLLLWAPVIASELGSAPSNAAALWRTGTVDRPRIGLAFLLERLYAAVAPIPAFLQRSDFLTDASPIQVLLAGLVIGGAGTLALRLRTSRPRGPIPWFVGLITLTMISSVWVGSRQPPLAAFRPDGTRWLWVVSLAIWVALLWAARALLPDAADARVDRRIVPSVALAAAAVVAVVTLATFDLADIRDGEVMPQVGEIAAATVDALPAGAYHLQFEGDQALLGFGPAIAYRLEESGSTVSVDDNTFGRAFGDQRTRDAGSTPTLRISSRTDAEAGDGEELLIEMPVDPDDPAIGTIKVFVRR